MSELELSAGRVWWSGPSPKRGATFERKIGAETVFEILVLAPGEGRIVRQYVERPCPACGKPVRRRFPLRDPRRRAARFLHPGCHADYLRGSAYARPSRAILSDLYERQLLTAREIGARYGRDESTVHQWLVTDGIPRRDTRYRRAL